MTLDQRARNSTRYWLTAAGWVVARAVSYVGDGGGTRENGAITESAPNSRQTSPGLRPPLSTRTGDRVAIVPASDCTDPTPPDRFTDAMSRVDGCPECVTNSETPYKVVIEAEGFVGYYHCADCGQLWTTSWGER